MRAAMTIRVVEKPAGRAEGEPLIRMNPPLSYVSTAEVAECTCPEPCERDHDRD
jgi:hypothetical protein